MIFNQSFNKKIIFVCSFVIRLQNYSSFLWIDKKISFFLFIIFCRNIYEWIVCVCVCICECLYVEFPYLWFVLCLIKRFYYILLHIHTFLFTQSFVCFCHQNHINIHLPYNIYEEEWYQFTLWSSISNILSVHNSVLFIISILFFSLHYILTFHFLCQDLRKEDESKLFPPKKKQMRERKKSQI